LTTLGLINRGFGKNNNHLPECTSRVCGESPGGLFRFDRSDPTVQSQALEDEGMF
jgi:hypothetical protein